jgi:signal peptidase I
MTEENKTKVSGFKYWLNFVWEILKIVIISLAIIVPIRYFLIQPFFVQGASMEPNYLDGDYLIVNEISYRFNEPQRGDVVIFKYPLDTSQFFIKRIIGLPGETVKIEDGRVFILGEEGKQKLILNESEYLRDAYTAGEMEVVLKNGEYFVLGDNRGSSSDSRKWGILSRNLIIGRAWIRAWPFNRLGILD